MSKLNIRIQMDFEVPKELVSLYQRSSGDPFIGYDEPLTYDEALSALMRYQRTKIYGGRERIAIMKIYEDDILVGYSLPRVVDETEYRSMKIVPGKSWYRLGTIYIDKPYRGKGLITEVVRLFREIYPNVCWQCEDKNLASFNSAIKAGLLFSHNLWFNNEGDKWSFEEDVDLPHPYRVLKTEL